jgi:hypothetical protein
MVTQIIAVCICQLVSEEQAEIWSGNAKSFNRLPD